MRIYTSYFYQVRNFPPNLIPLSTAIWDPKWYHANRDQTYQFKDKRGVLNGLRAEIFAPQPNNDWCLHCGPEQRAKYDGDFCPFKIRYYYQLSQLDFCSVWQRFITLAEKIKSKEGYADVDFALILHEAPGNTCSERSTIQRWFRENGNPIWEWGYDIISPQEILAQLKQQTT